MIIGLPQEKRQKTLIDSGGSSVAALRKPLIQISNRLEDLDGGQHVGLGLPCVCVCVCASEKSVNNDIV